MWNIRSHARRFPVHTGTLTPSIAHPNRFLNHLKRFSAGFLTFRGGKIKNCTVSGDKTNDFECAPGSWLALSQPDGLASSPKGRALGITAKFPGRPQSLRVRLLPLRGAVARSAAEGVIWVRTPGTDSRYGLLPSSLRDATSLTEGGIGSTPKLPANRKAAGFARASPFGRGVTAGDGEGSRREKLPQSSRFARCQPPRRWGLDMAGKLPDKLQSFRHARGSLSEGAGKTVRF